MSGLPEVERVRAELEVHPDQLDLYDDAAVAADRLALLFSGALHAVGVPRPLPRRTPPPRRRLPTIRCPAPQPRADAAARRAPLPSVCSRSPCPSSVVGAADRGYRAARRRPVARLVFFSDFI
ncbi:MAG: hypothetical protein KC621_06435 [Myxococcales bacterium]|nr:hypothetical protein [Myxococcales bacterium]